ncbi:MAG: hypothetical protein M3Y07_11430 [Acidobacteriota bacterium]|nr:hypothetical protein [Acidobacteriota bacterium]
MNGAIDGEETREYVVTPTSAGFERKLVSSSKHGEDLNLYMKLDVNDTVRVDYDSGTMTDGHSRDGIGRRLFPLTAAEQRRYGFRLMGRETFQGASVYRVRFTPRKQDDLAESSPWAGYALVDAREFEPRANRDAARARNSAGRPDPPRNQHDR